jgi:hypothetical protein
MTRLHHLETANVERSNRREAKRRAIKERKRLATIGALQRMRQRTETVLMDLKNAVSLLDQSIEAELENSSTRDPHHFAFPMTVRSLIARRENLKATTASLSDELSKNDQRERAVA